MHELHLLEDLLADIIKHAKANNLKKVSKINLKMGEFTEINPEILEFFFKEKAKNTLAENAKIIIKRSLVRELTLVSIES